MSTTAKADILLKISSDLAALRETQAELGKTKSALGGLVKSGAAFGAAAGIAGVSVGGLVSSIKGFISSGVRFNATLEQQGVAFRTLLGSASAADERMRDLVKFAAETPFELPQVVQASKLLQAFTGNALAAGDGLRMVGDAAAAVGQPFEAVAMWMGRLYAALRQGATIGEPIQNLTQLGLISNEARKQLFALQGRALSAGEAMAAMSRNFGQYSGAMASQSKTLNGQLSTLTDNVNALAGELSKPIFDKLRSGMSAANAEIGTVREQVISTTEALRDMAKWAAYATAAVGVGVAGTVAIQGGGLLLGGIIAAKFTAAVASAPIWATVGGVVAAGFLAAVGIARATGSAISAVNAQGSAEGREDATLASIRQRLRDARTPEDVASAGRLASRLAAGYRTEAMTATNDGGLFGVNGEKDRLEGMAAAYERLAQSAERSGEAIVAQGKAMDAARAAADVKAAADEAQRVATEATVKAATDLSEQLEKQADTLARRLTDARYDLATSEGKLALLKEEEAVARDLYQTQSEAAVIAGNAKAQKAAELTFAVALLDIAKRRAAVRKKDEEDAKKAAEEALKKELTAQETALARERDTITLARQQAENAQGLTTNERRAVTLRFLREERDAIAAVVTKLRERLSLETNEAAREAIAARIDAAERDLRQTEGGIAGASNGPERGLARLRTEMRQLGEDSDAAFTIADAGFQGMQQGIVDALQSARSLGDGFKKVFASIGNAILQAIQQLIAMRIATSVFSFLGLGASVPGGFGAGAGGANYAGTSVNSAGYFSGTSASFGFASGGYTGPGGKFDPAGIVHRGEYVMPQEAVNAIGVRALDAVRVSRSLPGYAAGGLVGGGSGGRARFGGDVLTFNYSFEAGVTRQEVAALIPAIERRVTAAVEDQRRRKKT